MTSFALTERLRVKLLSPRARLPTRASKDAVGYDLYSPTKCVVPAWGQTLIDIELAVAIPPGHYGRLTIRSSLCLRHHLHVGAGVIDPDYRGAIKVIMLNASNLDYEVCEGDRIAQLLVEKVSTPIVVEVDSLDDSARGMGGFGSSGR